MQTLSKKTYEQYLFICCFQEKIALTTIVMVGISFVYLEVTHYLN